MKFNVRVEAKDSGSFRVSALKGLYDLTADSYAQEFTGELPIEGAAWNIGLIVGSSGSGKSTVAQSCFGAFSEFSWKAPSLLDDFPKSVDSKTVFETLSAVGFASPPYWLKPFGVLSGGEKMRVELARAILEDKSPIVFDEFTSVVDRHIAQVGSLAIAKYVRRIGKQFVAVSCHRDIVPWLQPDWTYDTDERRFFFARKGSSGPSLVSASSLASVLYGASLKTIII